MDQVKMISFLNFQMSYMQDFFPELKEDDNRFQAVALLLKQAYEVGYKHGKEEPNPLSF